MARVEKPVPRGKRRRSKRGAGLHPHLIAATLGGGTVFPQVNVYLLEWVNPQPGKQIAATDFIGADKAVPTLLGITGGVKKSQ